MNRVLRIEKMLRCETTVDYDLAGSVVMNVKGPLNPPELVNVKNADGCTVEYSQLTNLTTIHIPHARVVDLTHLCRALNILCVVVLLYHAVVAIYYYRLTWFWIEDVT